MKFDMSINDNFASFVDEDSGISVFVDSFDNKEFDFRIGTITESESVGKIVAMTDNDLNEKISELFKNHHRES